MKTNSFIFPRFLNGKSDSSERGNFVSLWKDVSIYLVSIYINISKLKLSLGFCVRFSQKLSEQFSFDSLQKCEAGTYYEKFTSHFRYATYGEAQLWCRKPQFPPEKLKYTAIIAQRGKTCKFWSRNEFVCRAILPELMQLSYKDQHACTTSI